VPPEFNEHQWQRLVEAGPQIALAVAASSGSAGQSVGELEAFLRLVDQTADESGDESTLGRLAAAVRSKLAAGMLRGNAEDAIADGIHAAREAGAILAVQSDEQEARILRQWLLQAAYTVASAARDGGVLGRGGQEVSKVERETMDEIADGLGVVGDLDPGSEPVPGSESEPGSQSPPYAPAEPASKSSADSELDAEAGSAADRGPDGQPIGPDNIREGRVRGMMGGPNQTQGEGQG
jgi:hypothetical protein